MKIAVIGKSGGLFLDNAKYFFIDAAADSRVEVYFLAKDTAVVNGLKATGLENAYVIGTEAADKCLATADWLVADTFCFKMNPNVRLNPRTRVCQLWHGVGPKKAGFPEAHSSLVHSEEKRRWLEAMYSGYDALLATSPAFELLFSQYFSTAAMVRANFPRNRVVVTGPQSEADYLSVDFTAREALREIKAARKAILYAPTFRDVGDEPVKRHIEMLKKVAAACSEMGVVLFVKPHEADQRYAETNRRMIQDAVGSDVIRFISPASDVYPLFRDFDLLISDYSSIVADFILTGAPVVIYAADAEEYLGTSRECVFDLDLFSPVKASRDTDSLVTSIRESLGDAKPIDVRRRQVRDFYFSTSAWTATSDVISQLISPISSWPKVSGCALSSSQELMREQIHLAKREALNLRSQLDAAKESLHVLESEILCERRQREEIQVILQKSEALNKAIQQECDGVNVRLGAANLENARYHRMTKDRLITLYRKLRRTFGCWPY